MNFAILLPLLAQGSEPAPPPTTAETQAEAVTVESDPAEATEEGPGDPDIVVEAEKVRKKVVCRKEKTVGSGIAKRVCRTVEQIAADKKNAKDFHGRARGVLDADAASRLRGN